MMFNFGAKSTTASAPPVGGLTFGSTSATSSSGFPTFGSTATTTSHSTAPIFGFGSQTPAQTFGATTTTAPSIFGANTSTTPSLFGATTTTAPSLFGATTTTAPSLFGGTTTSAPSLFGGITTSAPSLFSGNPTSAPSLFGPNNTGGVFSGFKPNGVAPAPAQSTTQQTEALLISLSQPLIFGDERDVVLARWNQLQAMYGSGVGYCMRGPVPYGPENPFCRLKTVAYNVMPQARDEDGLVMLLIGKRPADVTAQRQQLIDTLFRLLGNKANLAVELEDVREASVDGKTEALITVTERLPTGSSRKVLASELAAYLTGNMMRPQMESQLLVQRVAAHVAPTSSQLAQYLEKPPAGFNPLPWQQARQDNPNEARFLPVPLVGFGDVKRRMLVQETQAERQQERLQKISEDIAELKCSQTNMSVKIEQMKRRQMELSLRVLKVLCRQEVIRQQGCSLSAEEELLRCALEKLWNELVVPCGAKSRLQEMLSTIRMGDHALRRDQWIAGAGGKLQFDAETSIEIRDHLMKQQDGIQHLISVVQEDMKSLKIIENGLTKGVSPLR